MTHISFSTHVRREIVRTFSAMNITLVPPLISILLYVIVFGFVLGSRISEINGIPYIEFIAPGLILMNVIIGSYSNPSGSIFMSRFLGNINDVLLSPLSYFEMVAAYIIGGVIRGLLLGVGAYVILFLFHPNLALNNAFVVIYSLIVISLLFACFGIIIGLWADTFERLNIFLNFAITPLTFLGGVFYSVSILPPALQTITRLNPMFYMVDAFRFGMIGVSESNLVVGLTALTIVAILALVLVTHLFRIGWKLRT